MKNLIKVPVAEIGHLEFAITAIDCEGSQFDHFQETVGENPETGEIYEEINYTRSAYGRVEYEAVYQDKVLKLSFDWEAEASRKGSYVDSFDFDVSFADEPCETANFVFVDEEGDIENMNLEEIEDRAGSFDDFPSAAKPLLPVPEDDEVLVEDVVMDENQGSGIRDYIVERDNAVDLRFKGQILAEATSKDPYNDGGRWQELTLYKTVGGKYICSKVDVTRWIGERTRSKAEVCTGVSDVIKFFGMSSLAKELYEEAEINNAEIVD